jgi:hypothetical protein
MYGRDYRDYRRWKRGSLTPDFGDDLAGVILEAMYYMVALTVMVTWDVLRFLVIRGIPFVRFLFSNKAGVIVGYTKTALGRGLPIRVPPKVRPKHLHVIGPTGSGKTTTLINLAVQDFRAGNNSVVVIDPKGELVPALLSRIPPKRMSDVILFDATDRQHPIGFNILDAVDPNNKERAADGFVQAFRKLSGDDWGVRLNRVLRYAVFTLMDMPGSTVLHIRPLLYDEEFRKQALSHVTNQHVLNFWQTEYPKMTKRGLLTQVVTPIMNRIDAMLLYPTVANIVGQSQSSFSLRDVVENGKILLVNIPQGEIGEGISSFLGAILVAQIQMAAMTNLAGAGSRPPLYLYIDEFQNFVTSAFDKIVNEARAYKMGLVVANQFSQQLALPLRQALDHNVAIRLTCQTNRGRHWLIYHQVQEVPEEYAPYLLAMKPASPGNPTIAARVKAQSQQRYAAPAGAVPISAMTPTTVAQPPPAPTRLPPVAGHGRQPPAEDKPQYDSPDDWIED